MRPTQKRRERFYQSHSSNENTLSACGLFK